MIRFLRSENGAEVTELAIVLSLIVALSIVLITSIGQSVLQMFIDTDSGLP